MTKQQADWVGIGALLMVFLVTAIALFANIPHRISVMQDDQVVSGGDPRRAPAAVIKYGCGTCHQIPGISGADGMVGPSLADVSRHSFIAGQLANNPDNLVLWIEHPQQVRPGGDMPEMGVTEQDARDIAAYLYSLH